MGRRIGRRPNAVRFEEVRQLLEAYGWTLDRIRGSHYVFARGSETLVVPHRRPHVLPVYVRRVLAVTQEEADAR